MLKQIRIFGGAAVLVRAVSLLTAGAVTAGAVALATCRLRNRRDRYFHLAEVLEQTGTPAFVKDLTGRYRLTSAAYERLQGIPPGGAAGRHDHEVHPAGRLAEIRRRDRAALAADGPVAFEDTLSDAGRRRRFITTLYALRDHRDRPYAIFGVAAEVTHLRAAETDLRSQAHENARLAAIVEASQDAIVSKTPNGVIKTWNPGAERLYGYTAEEMIGSDVTRLLPPDRLGEERELLARVLGGQAVNRFETRRRRKDGTLIEVSLSMAPMRDADDTVIGASTVAHDITSRVQAEQRRRVEREQLEMIMQAASDPFFTMDAAGVITEWNRQAEHVFGWPRTEILGQDVTGTILPARYHAALRRLLDGRLDWLLDRPTEMTAAHRDGHEIPVELTMWCIRHGDSPHFHGFVRDITARLETEQALAEARDQAIEAARLKSRFLASMSHEIRTPMNGVIGLTGLLLGSTLDERQRRYAEGIGAAGAALLSVINDILDFSKLEAGKALLEDANFQVARLVADVVALVAPPDTQKAVTVSGTCHPDLPATVSGDPARLRQVLLNLAGNAVKFTPRGRVAISAVPDRTVSAAPGAVPIRFEVHDTGIGIDRPEMERLFEAFTQADASTTRRFGGTGLGLAISRDLVELMGGRIGVESVPGEGSTFWFTVTLRTAREGLDLFDRHCLDGLRVLIVEAGDDDRTVLLDQLAAWSMDATGVPDEAGATRALAQAATAGRPFDLVIADVETAPVETLAPPGCPVPKTILLAADPARLPGEPDPRVSAAFAKPLRQSQLFDALAGVLAEADSDRTVDTMVQENPPGRGHLLVVEDNEINRTVALGILANLGYTADVAVNGRQAVDLALSRDYRAILMDCLMPEMDGYQATEEIRRHEPPGRHVPIIALTASALAEDRARCLAAGMDEHLAKPLVPVDVSRVLERWSRHAPPDPATVIAEIERRLDQLRGPDPAATAGALAGLLATLSAKIPEHLDRIQQALAFDDPAGTRAEAHQLMGVLANLGAGAASAACGRIESAARAGDLDAAVTAFTDARPLIMAARDAADQIRRRPGPVAFR
ncbi:PAS domain S-box protein [Actinoplanes sp. NPDC049802]|uniref:PAS domain S-box protein n=1 Tax=Actinoplanes sp. NPDC049802 TaxID=3154742 RepID=UPI0033C9ACC6